MLSSPLRITTSGGTTTIATAVAQQGSTCTIPTGFVVATVTKSGTGYTGHIVNINTGTCKPYDTYDLMLAPIANPQAGNTGPALAFLEQGSLASEPYRGDLLKCANTVPDTDPQSLC